MIQNEQHTPPQKVIYYANRTAQHRTTIGYWQKNEQQLIAHAPAIQTKQHTTKKLAYAYLWFKNELHNITLVIKLNSLQAHS